MPGVFRLDPSMASFDAARRQPAAQAPRRSRDPGVGAGSRDLRDEAFATELFAVRLRRALTGALAAAVDPAIDAPGARGAALAARDRLVGQALTIANADGRAPSLL